MRRRSLLSLIAPLAVHLSGCDGGPTPTETTEAEESSSLGPSPIPDLPRPSRDEAAGFATSSNVLGFDLYRSAARHPGNIAFSPTSVALAMSMAYGGAAGETASQMKEALHLSGTPDETGALAGKLSAALQAAHNQVKLRIANRLFGQRGFPFRTGFLEATKRNFGAPLERMAFDSDAEGARKGINGWVEAQTEGHIRELIQPGGLRPEARLVLVNAIYFQAEWSLRFHKEMTSPRPFQSPSGAHDVPTMHRTFEASYAEPDGQQLLQLPYYGGTMSMLLVLPRRGAALAELEAQLSNDKLESWARSLGAREVSVALPKFKIEPASPLSLKAALSELGMRHAFDENAADLSGMVDTTKTDKRLFLDDLVHKATVVVDEHGTEAAGATAMLVAVAAAAPRPAVPFEADRPFLFFVRDNASGAVLFIGRVEDPAQG